MTIETLGRLFISYSHSDKSYMSIFKKHLQGMLLNRVQVWSDQDISQGVDWDTFLRGNLDLASSALVLASSDYLISQWCREELKELAAAQRGKRLRNVFWIQLRPCGWEQTELSNLQSFPNNLDVSIDELIDENLRHRTILELCEHIALDIIHSINDRDATLASVRRWLLSGPDVSKNITVTDVISEGDFSIVCKGFKGEDVVAVKILKWTPLKKIGNDILIIGNKRRQLTDPLFLHLLDIFQIGPESEKRTVFVSQYMPKTKLLSNLLDVDRNNSTDKDTQDQISVDKAVLLLRRMAEGLVQLHGLSNYDDSDEGDHKDWKNAIGLLRADDIYYDGERLRISAIGVSSFLWNIFDYTVYAKWIDSDSKSYVAPEQPSNPIEGLTALTDQYMLGRLAIELLEHKLFKQILNGESVEKFWDDPQRFVKLPWKSNHPQLWKVVEKMVRKDPKKRFSSMADVVKSLRSVELEYRALAKQTYQGVTVGADGRNIAIKLKDNDEFFKQFYKRFFDRSPESENKFKGIDPHAKLMKAMVAILNYTPGNDPTSIDEFVGKHNELQISAIEFRRFHKSFLETLQTYVLKNGEVWKAWDNLLTPITEHMISACCESPSRTKPGNEAAEASGETVYPIRSRPTGPISKLSAAK